MPRAVVYTRVSTDKQEAEGDSLQAQEADCRADCERFGDTVVAVTTDTYSGHDSMNDRPGLQEALRMFRNGEADVLVVKRVSRMARDMVDAQVIFRSIKESGGRFRSVVEGPMSNKADGGLLMAIHSFQAEKDWETIAEQTQQGLKSRVSLGRPLTSVALYGYHHVDGDRHREKYWTKMELVRDDESAPVVELIFDKADAGWGCRRIADWLTEQGYLTPSQLLHKRGELGNRRLTASWSKYTVYKILTNESYTGRHAAFRYHYTKDRKGGIKHRTKGTSLPISIPALVDVAVFERVNASLTGRQQSWAKIDQDDEPLLNKGIAVCGMCGATMGIARHHHGRYRMYVCSRRGGAAADKAHQCSGGAFAVRASEVDEDIWAKVKDIIRDEPRYQRLTQGKTQKLAEQHQEAVRQAETVARELAEMRERVAMVHQASLYEKSDYVRAMNRAELDKLIETVAALEKRASQSQAAVNAAQVKRDTHKILLQAIASLLKRHEKWLELSRRYLVEQGMDPELAPQLIENTVNAVEGLDELTREERRAIMRDLDVKVPMFPVDVKVPTVYKYPTTTGKRWDFIFSDGVLSGMSP